MAIEEKDKVKARVAIIKKSISNKGKERTTLNYEIRELRDELIKLQKKCQHPIEDRNIGKVKKCGICQIKLS